MDSPFYMVHTPFENMSFVLCVKDNYLEAFIPGISTAILNVGIRKKYYLKFGNCCVKCFYSE